MRVFISYRRADSIGVAGRMRDRLVHDLTAEDVFFDIDSIPLGVDFRDHIDRSVSECDVVLVVIGRRWIDITDELGRRRLDDPDDFVRLEVEAALRREIPVIPVLVDGASMPTAGELPETITALAFRNGMPVRVDPDFHPDMNRLIGRLAPRRARPTPDPADPGGARDEATKLNVWIEWRRTEGDDLRPRPWTIYVRNGGGRPVYDVTARAEAGGYRFDVEFGTVASEGSADYVLTEEILRQSYDGSYPDGFRPENGERPGLSWTFRDSEGNAWKGRDDGRLTLQRPRRPG